MHWSDLKLPPINLWSLPKMTKQIYKNDAFDFTLEDESEIDEASLEELNDDLGFQSIDHIEGLSSNDLEEWY
jgi:hypothetical protein